MRLRHTVSALAVVSVAVLGLSACSEESDSTATEKETPSASASASTDAGEETASAEPEASASPAEEVDLDIVYKNGKLSPNAQEMTAKVGEPLTVRITADAAGELHVHAKPEQHLEFAKGLTTTDLVFETPGSVEIESHDTGSVIALIEVRG